LSSNFDDESADQPHWAPKLHGLPGGRKRKRGGKAGAERRNPSRRVSNWRSRKAAMLTSQVESPHIMLLPIPEQQLPGMVSIPDAEKDII
jgi:hypothetical protein